MPKWFYIHNNTVAINMNAMETICFLDDNTAKIYMIATKDNEYCHLNKEETVRLRIAMQNDTISMKP